MRNLNLNIYKKMVFFEFLVLSSVILLFLGNAIINKNFVLILSYLSLFTLFIIVLSVFSSITIIKIYLIILNKLNNFKKFLQNNKPILDKISFALFTFSFIITLLSIFNINIYSYLGISSTLFIYSIDHTLKII